MKDVLIVGCGSIGRRHAANAARLASVTVFDTAAQRLADAARTLNLASSTSLEEALARKPNAVVVATPQVTHLNIASAAITSGADVLIEKPIACSLDGLPEFLERAEQRHKRVRVVCNMRFHPAVAALHDHIALIGKPLFARAQYGNYLPNMRPGVDYRELYCARAETGGGVILDAIHEIDYLMWLFGPVARVNAVADRVGNFDIDVEDYAAITLKHASGVHSEIHLDYLQRSKRRSCEIAGTDGTLIWLSEGKIPEHCVVRFHPPGERAPRTLLDLPSVDSMQPYVEVMTRFLNSNVHDDGLLDGHGATANLAVALAAQRSAATGRTVTIETSR